MTVQSQDGIRDQAELLARENREADPEIEDVFWFPDAREVRLVETSPVVPRCTDMKIHPFYFRAAPEDDLPAPSAIALIRPDEVRQAELPEGWGSWDDGRKL